MNKPWIFPRGTAHNPRLKPRRRAFFRALAALGWLSFCPPLPASELEPVVLETWLNHHNHGELFLLYDPVAEPADSIHLTPRNLVELGVQPERIQPWENRETIPLTELAPGLRGEFDLMTLRLNLRVDPAWLQPREISVRPPPVKPSQVFVPSAPVSAYLNYAAHGTWQKGERELNIPWDFGLRAGAWMLESQHLLRANAGESQRFFTRATWDHPTRLQRFVVGDFSPAINAASGAPRLGGVSWRSHHDRDPDFSRYPELRVHQLLDLPAALEVYVNEALIDTWQVQSGPLILRDLIPRTGQGLIRLRLRDVLAGEHEFRYPYWISSDLLKPGLHQFQYNLGLQRHGQNGYRDWAASGRHRVGITQNLTATADFEWTGDAQYVSTALVGVLGGRWQGGLTAHGLRRESQTAMAITARLQYQRRNFSLSWAAEHYGNGYLQGETNSAAPRVRQEAGLALHPGAKWGSLSLGWEQVDFWGEEPQQTSLRLNYQRKIGERLHFLINARARLDGARDYIVFASLGYRFGQQTRVAFKTDLRRDQQRHQITLRQQPKRGQSHGYQVSLQQDSDQARQAAARWQSHWPKGKLDTAARIQSTGEAQGELAWSGAIAWIPGHGAHFSRPIHDAFALVQTGQPNVPVEAGGQNLGRTGKKGYALLPEISSFYENRLKIPPEALPLNLSLDRPVQYLKPRYRAGTLVPFAITKITAVEGYLYRRENGEEAAIDQDALTLQVGDQTRHGLIGKEGYFYFENLPPGEHQGQLRQSPCLFIIPVRDSDEVIQSAGKIYCD